LDRAYELFKFTTITGESSQIRVDRARSRDLKCVYRALLQANAALPMNEPEAEYLVQCAIETRSPLYFYYATDLGWRFDAKCFMFWDEGVLSPDGTDAIVPPEWAEHQANGHLTKSGKLRHWKNALQAMRQDPLG
jgi:hypothetical protein